MDEDPFGVELGEFLYPQGYARFRHIPFSPQQSLIMVSVLDGVSSNMLEEMLAEFPHDFHEFTQVICRDLWNALKHLSVPMEDVWIRVARGIELSATSTFHSLVLADDVILLVLIPTAGRVDAPVLESCLSSTSRSATAFRNGTTFLQKKFHRPSHYSIGLTHSTVFRGSNVRASDLDFLGSLKYATLSRESDGYYSSGSVVHQKSSVPQKSVVQIVVRMDEIRSWLAPPPKPLPPAPRPKIDASQLRAATASPLKSTIGSQAVQLPIPARVLYRPLTPTRNRPSDQSVQYLEDASNVTTGGASQIDTRLFKPYSVGAEATPFRGSRPGLEATIAADSAAAAFYHGGAVRGAPGNVSYLGSVDVDGGDPDLSLVHVVTHQNHRQSSPVAPQQVSTTSRGPSQQFYPTASGINHDAQSSYHTFSPGAHQASHTTASRSGQHYTIRPAAHGLDASRNAPSIDNSNTASTPIRVVNGRTIVPTPTHFPPSHSRWEERQARAPSLYQ
jgi:hypothetical protein